MSRPKAIYVNRDEIAALKLTGDRLILARELCMMTQIAAAQLIGTSRQALNDAENGRLNPLPIKLLKSAAELYSVSADWLLCLTEDWEQDQTVSQQRDLFSSFHRARINHYSKMIAEQIQAGNAA